MATKNAAQQPSMIETLKEFKNTKNIDRTTLVSVLEESFRNVIAKIFGSDENFDVIVNPDKGDLEIYRNRVVVEDGQVVDENKEIELTEALKIAEDYEVGEEVSEPVDFASFGRRAILNLRQTLASKILELEHDSLYNQYKDRVGELVSGEVYQAWKREVLIIAIRTDCQYPIPFAAFNLSKSANCFVFIKVSALESFKSIFIKSSMQIFGRFPFNPFLLNIGRTLICGYMV